MKKSLHSAEWVLVLSLLLIMGSLFLIAKVNAHRAFTTLEIKEKEHEDVSVLVEGAVAKPGSYLVPTGTTIGQVLRKARPKPWANLQIIPRNQIIEKPLSIRVEEVAAVTVFVRGAVTQAGEITLPSRSRVCDLRTKISLTPDADKRFFRRRKLLKNGDIIDVPKKTVE